MSSKSKLFEMEETRRTYNAGVLLKQFAQGLYQHELRFACGENAFSVPLPPEVQVEVEVKRKEKSDKVKGKIEIEISWTEPAVAQDDPGDVTTGEAPGETLSSEGAKADDECECK
jgi:amphi-Trp domain-containing protein